MMPCLCVPCRKRIISGSGDYEVYEAGDGEEAVVLYEKLKGRA